MHNQQLTVDVETANNRAEELKCHSQKLESSLEKVSCRSIAQRVAHHIIDYRENIHSHNVLQLARATE